MIKWLFWALKGTMATNRIITKFFFQHQFYMPFSELEFGEINFSQRQSEYMPALPPFIRFTFEFVCLWLTFDKHQKHSHSA